MPRTLTQLDIFTLTYQESSSTVQPNSTIYVAKDVMIMRYLGSLLKGRFGIQMNSLHFG